jgi:hypothetical protein
MKEQIIRILKDEINKLSRANKDLTRFGDGYEKAMGDVMKVLNNINKKEGKK